MALGEGILARLCRVFALVSGYALVATMLVVVANVVLRPFGYPIKGAFEWSGFLTALVVGLSLAECGVRGGHIAVTFLADKLPQKAQAVVDLVMAILGAFFLALAAFELTRYATGMIFSGEVAFTTQLPYYPFVYLVAFGFALFCLVYVFGLVEVARKVAGR